VASDDSAAVQAANDAFYRAFESLKLEAMEAVWLRSARVHCTHPGWRRLSGIGAVMDSWRGIFENTMEMRFELTGVEVSVAGEVAWVVCTENITSHTLDGISRGRVEATNVFERRDGQWLLVHHHGSPASPSVDDDDPTPALQ
jgi:ketosteroid isomerase-like protein